MDIRGCPRVPRSRVSVADPASRFVRAIARTSEHVSSKRFAPGDASEPERSGASAPAAPRADGHDPDVRFAPLMFQGVTVHATLALFAALCFERRVVISGGENAGIRVGSRFSVLGPPRHITDPVTGDVIETIPGHRVGRIEVIQVREKSAHATLLDGKANRGDLLQPE